MPYMLHLRGTQPETGTPYDVQADAIAALQANPDGLKLTFLATAEQIASWREREEARFESREYMPVPWARGRETADHYAHMSQKETGKIAYTKSIEHGIADRQTCIRPGKYLEQFLKDVLTPEQIAGYIAVCGELAHGLKIATSADDIERVYTGGPSSCMSHHASDYETGGTHPARAYGDSDLAVAYYGDMGKASARSVVWPAKMLHTRVYGGNGVLERLLQSAGYSQGSLRGAKIRAIETDNGDDQYLMPYVDYISGATLKGSWFTLGSGAYSTSETNGTTGLQDERAICQSCNERFDDDEYGGEGECQSCYDDHYTSCERCSETVSLDEIHTVHRSGKRYEEQYCTHCRYSFFSDCANCNESIDNDDLQESSNGDHYCEDCYSELSPLLTCAMDGCDAEWREDNLDNQEQKTRATLTDEDRAICVDCNALHVWCADCETYRDIVPVLRFDTELPIDGGIVPARDYAIAEVSYQAVCQTCQHAIACPEGQTSMHFYDAPRMSTRDPICMPPAYESAVGSYRMNADGTYERLADDHIAINNRLIFDLRATMLQAMNAGHEQDAYYAAQRLASVAHTLNAGGLL